MSAINANPSDPALIADPFFQVHITHLPTNNTISFKGWVTEFSDAFTSTWNSETVYGRMDPLVTFQNTGRAISLGFDLPAADGNEAAANLARLNRLAQFLYPMYSEGPDRTIQNTLQGGPLIGLKWTNMIGNAQNGERLIGYLGGFTYQPDLNAGSFFSTGTSTDVVDTTTNDDRQEGYETRDVSTSSERVLIPKLVSVSLNFTVLHTQLTGWYKGGGGAGGYTFGNSDVDAKFPSAHFVVNSETQSQESDIGGGDDDSYENVGEIQKSKESEVLNKGGVK